MTSRRDQAITNLSSGSKEDLRLQDPGSFSMNMKIQGQVSAEKINQQHAKYSII